MARRRVESSAQPSLTLEPEPIGTVEAALAARGERAVIGVDEVGRGPLAGPVVVAAVVMPLPIPGWTPGLTDSKQLTEAARRQWDAEIRAQIAQFAVVEIDAVEIDRLNILQASLEGMRRAVEELGRRWPESRALEVLVDGNKRFDAPHRVQQCLVGGDARAFSIAAASVLAKVHRDTWMTAAAARYPGYGFERHVGYPTPEHLRALAELGPCALHRRSFGPVRRAVTQQTR